jgi:hypothetical protein
MHVNGEADELCGSVQWDNSERSAHKSVFRRHDGMSRKVWPPRNSIHVGGACHYSPDKSRVACIQPAEAS